MNSNNILLIGAGIAALYFFSKGGNGSSLTTTQKRNELLFIFRDNVGTSQKEFDLINNATASEIDSLYNWIVNYNASSVQDLPNPLRGEIQAISIKYNMLF